MDKKITVKDLRGLKGKKNRVDIDKNEHDKLLFVKQV